MGDGFLSLFVTYIFLNYLTTCIIQLKFFHLGILLKCALQLKNYFTISTFAGLNHMPKNPLILGTIKIW